MNSAASECATCGLYKADPLHDAFHKITAWNKYAFKVAREKSEKEFERRIAGQKKKERGWSSPSM